MANAISSCISGIFHFTVDVTNLSTNSVESSEMRLSDVNWKIRLQKSCATDDGGKEVLSVHLMSAFVNSAPNLSCKAQAAFKLIGYDGQMDQSIVKYLQNRTFDNVKRSHGFDDFIDWNDFHMHYVRDGNAIFKIEISAEPVHRICPLDIQQEAAKLHLLVENVRDIQCCTSAEIVVRGIKWKLMIKKTDDSLGIFLCADKTDMDKNWLYKADCTFQLLAVAEDDVGIKRFTTAKFNHDTDDWGYLHFIKWAEFIGPRFTVGDKATFIVEFKVHEPKPLWQLDRPNLSKANTLLQCSVCLECFQTGQISTIKCGHLFCEPCFTKSIENQQICARCKASTTAGDLHPIFF